RRVDPAPPSVASRAAEAYSWRSIDDELALLVYDSLLDPSVSENVRSAPYSFDSGARSIPGAQGLSSRQLTFQAPELILEVEVSGSSPRELMCQVVPPQPATLEIRHRNGTVELAPDRYGTFHLCPLPRGPVCLRCQPIADEPGPVATSWIEL
ncbi:MAG: hypothetical protein ACRDZP_02060, partial [Acidimicrobiales bacterium]